MHMKYNFNLFLVQITILFIINSVTANVLEKLTDMTLAGK